MLALVFALIMAVSIPNPQLGANLDTTAYNGLLQNSAGNLYFASMAQFGIGANFALTIWESTDAGNTWARIVSDANRGGATGFAPVMIADVLHFAIANASIAPNTNLGIYRYNTLTHAFLADDYGGPNPTNTLPADYLTATALSDGSITMAYISNGAGNPAALVNWKAGIWGAPVLIAAQVPILCPAWAIKETTSERIHFFFTQNTPGSVSGTVAIWHVSQESSSALNALQNVIADGSNLKNLTNPIGAPCIFGADIQIVVPFTWGPPNMGANNVFSIRVLRATPAANPVWSNEEAVSNGALPNTELEPYLNYAYFGVSAIDQAGSITLVFSVDNNTAAPALQGWLYTTSTTVLVGGWGAPVLLFTDPAGQTNSSTYALKTGGSTYGLVVGTIVPSGAPHIADLSLWFVGAGRPPVPPAPPSPTTYWNPGTSVSLLCEKQYPWSVPPADRIPVSLRGSIPAPVANMITELWEYQVPDGFWFVYDRVMLFATVTGYIDGSGSIIWILDANVPLGGALPVGRPIAQFTAAAGELAEPVQVAPTQLYQGDTLRAKAVITDGTLGVGLPNVIHATVEGWLFPHSRNS